MNRARFEEITGKYASLRIAVVGDFCLDRYLEIDPARQEISIETGLPVHNVVNVRSQPGAAGTILNNLVALGIGTIYPVGFAGEDGEGFELRRALRDKAGVRLDHFLQTPLRRTFTYTKPLVKEPGKTPVELNRLDIKNWSTTPALVEGKLMDSVFDLATEVNAMIVMDQVDIPETGVVTSRLLETVHTAVKTRPNLLVLADSRRGLSSFPPVCWKMNAAELGTLAGATGLLDIEAAKQCAAGIAVKNFQRVFVTMAGDGIVGSEPNGSVHHAPALPLRGEIDVVGAGDAVTANLVSALSAGASAREAMELANAAASIVIHQLGTTGTASVREIGRLKC